MLNRKAKETVEKLIESGYEELYYVENRISNEQGCTSLWNIYADLEDATRWVRLCHSHDKIVFGVKGELLLPVVMNVGDLGINTEWSYVDRFGNVMDIEFLIRRVL